MKKILCVCALGNCCKPTVATLLQGELGKEFAVYGAGVAGGLVKMLGEDYWLGGLRISKYACVVCMSADVAALVRSLLIDEEVPVLIAGGTNPCGNGAPAYHRCPVFAQTIVSPTAAQVRRIANSNLKRKK